MLFRPLKPVKIPVAGWLWQGVLPKRHRDLARSLGRAVENDLLSVEAILDRLMPPETVDHLVEGLVARVKERLERSTGFLPPWLRAAVVSMAVGIARREARDYLIEALEGIRRDYSSRLDVSGMVEEKIQSFSLEELEKLILSLTARELRHIEILGGVLGAVIGLIQVIVSQVLISQIAGLQL